MYQAVWLPEAPGPLSEQTDHQIAAVIVVNHGLLEEAKERALLIGEGASRLSIRLWLGHGGTHPPSAHSVVQRSGQRWVTAHQTKLHSLYIGGEKWVLTVSIGLPGTWRCVL